MAWCRGAVGPGRSPSPTVRAVLSVARVGRGRFTYYLETVASGRDDAAGLVEADGAWVGATTASLGLERVPVDRESLSALLDGVDPSSGEVLDPHHARVRVAGFDLTFGAPKSVSLVHALSADGDVVGHVREAHDRSVRAALSYLEDEAGRVRRRAGGEDRVLSSAGLAGASFLHRTSRAPDPHLHSHVLIANLGRDDTCRWSALDARALFVHVGVAGALYRAQLRAELVSRLGVTWRWRSDGFADLAGLRPEALRAFSRRHEEITAALAESGRSGAVAARAAAVRTRAAKDLSTSYERLVEEWRERAESVGISVGGVAAVVPRRSRVETIGPGASHRSRRGAPVVTDAPFTRRAFIVARAQALEDGGSVAEIVRRVDAELASGRAAGTVLDDPDRSATRRGLRGRAGGRIPAGFEEPGLVTAEYLERERAMSHVIAAARPFTRGALSAGLWCPRASASVPVEVASEVAAVIGSAVRDRRSVLLLAPRGLEAAHAEAVLGLAAAPPGRAGIMPHESLVVAFGADRWLVTDLDAAVASARSTGSSLVLVASTTAVGRGVLRDALDRARQRSSIARDVAPAPSARSREDPGPEVLRRYGAGPVAVQLVADPGDLVRAVVVEQARQREELGESTVVVADRVLARTLVAAVGPGVRVIAAPDASLGGRDARGGGLVVIGGAAVLDRRVRRDPSTARVHVAVAPPGAPPGAPPETLARWGAYRASGRRRDARALEIRAREGPTVGAALSASDRACGRELPALGIR